MLVRVSSAGFELGTSGHKPAHAAIFVCPQEVIDSVIILLALLRPGSQVP